MASPVTTVANKTEMHMYRWDQLYSVPRPVTGISESHVQNIMARYNPNYLSQPVVNARVMPDNSVQLRVLDGNHELAAAMRLGLGHEMIRCEVYNNLSDSEEAEVVTNRQREKRAYRQSDAFGLDLIRGDEAATAIKTLLEQSGLSLSDRGGGSSNGAHPTVAPLRRVYSKYGAGVLMDTLQVLSTVPSWQDYADRWHGGMVAAVSRFLHEGARKDRLITKLDRITPGYIIGNATKKFHGYKLTGGKKSQWNCIYDEVKRHYNSRGTVPTS